METLSANRHTRSEGTLNTGSSTIQNLDEESRAEVPDHFIEKLSAIGALRMQYIIRNREAETQPGVAGSEEFAEQAYSSLFADTSVWNRGELERFFRWAVERKTPCKFALVLAALNAIRTNDFECARRYAWRAHQLLINDLFIQKLLRRAAGKDNHDSELSGRFCRAPFESIETTPNGDVHFCCPAWLPVPIGNLNQSSPEEIWNSSTAQEIRRSIHDGSYRYCSRVHCALLSSDALPKKQQLNSGELSSIASSRLTKLASRPRKLALAHDRSCTLSCPSCRTKTIIASRAEQTRLNSMADKVLFPLARDARRVRVTSSGDPFGSSHFRYVLKGLARDKFPQLTIEIQTNGVLFDETAWVDLDLAGRLGLVAISLDAAREETYAVVRRGGSFRRLHRNLEFLAGRRRAGEISLMRLDFVVQGLNFREMPEFVATADRYNVDRIKFQMIRNWQTYCSAEFAEHNIGARDHPLYREFIQVLRHPGLRSERIEYWGMREALEDAASLG